MLQYINRPAPRGNSVSGAHARLLTVTHRCASSALARSRVPPPHQRLADQNDEQGTGAALTAMAGSWKDLHVVVKEATVLPHDLPITHFGNVITDDQRDVHAGGDARLAVGG
ncbi:MAG: hypothetical protein NVSMB65_06540 [Chloroflexota bacterium]